MPPRRPRNPLRGGPFGRRPPRPRPSSRQPRSHPFVRQLNPLLQRELRRANHLMGTGDHANAAEIFTSLAERAQDLGILGPAAMLFLQAGRAHMLGAETEAALERAMSGLKLLAAGERWPALQREGERIAEEFERQGLDKAAAGLRAWLDEKLGNQAARVETEKKGKLPEKCPYCGASMSLEQMRGGKAAECRYCGSVVLSAQMD